MKTGFLHMRKQRCRSAQLISAFVFTTQIVQSFFPNFKPLACFCDCAGWFASDLVGKTGRLVFLQHGSFVIGCVLLGTVYINGVCDLALAQCLLKLKSVV